MRVSLFLSVLYFISFSSFGNSNLIEIVQNRDIMLNKIGYVKVVNNAKEYPLIVNRKGHSEIMSENKYLLIADKEGIKTSIREGKVDSDLQTDPSREELSSAIDFYSTELNNNKLVSHTSCTSSYFKKTFIGNLKSKCNTITPEICYKMKEHFGNLESLKNHSKHCSNVLDAMNQVNDMARGESILKIQDKEVEAFKNMSGKLLPKPYKNSFTTVETSWKSRDDEGLKFVSMSMTLHKYSELASLCQKFANYMPEKKEEILSEQEQRFRSLKNKKETSSVTEE